MTNHLLPDRRWQGDSLDLDAFLARVGYEGDRAPTLETLTALQRGYVTTFPFENIEAVLRRPVPLDLDALQTKLLRSPRGGYCFEHVTLFAAALERLGFGVIGMTGRVTLGSDKLRPATHALLRVETADGRAWFCDVGFGGGPLAPLPFEDGAEEVHDGWAFRLRLLTDAAGGLPGAQEWALFEKDEDWVERHTFGLAPSYGLDYHLANFFISTHPRSVFVGRLFAQKFTVEAHHQLDELSYTVKRPGGGSDVRELTPAEVPVLLDETFGITLSPEDTELLTEHLKA
ncbi:arylamine N-acetyltransferase family protein [Spirillospora sp. CA-294931]|uniref:arylamine N-acetyltransferase family protein n=1 Tax=Spirillospora sp. CA-294931 TaxID=3240042 RepID=UPI003D92B980